MAQVGVAGTLMFGLCCAVVAAEGLQLPETSASARTYSDLLWTKDDYRAWIKGSGYRAAHESEQTTSVFPFSFVAEPVAPPPGAMSQWRLGQRNWQYAPNNGLAVRLGADDVTSSVLSGAATLGGLHLRQSSLEQPDDAQNWSLSFALGALDYSDASQQGDLTYGPLAANTVIQYGINENIALESALQVAPDLVTTSLAGRLDAGQFGELRAGVAHSNLAEQDGWRYQAGYDVQLIDDLHLSVRSEWDAPGFADLGQYQGGATPGIRRHWAATVPATRWGDISGTYESFRPAIGTATEKFGFSQQFWYSPNLRIGLEAKREVGSGDYDIGLRFSVPIY